MPAIRGQDSKKKTRRHTRDLDQVHADLRDEKHLAEFKDAKPIEDLPGLGQNYCLECAKFFESEANMLAHKKGKVHKRRYVLKKSPAVRHVLANTNAAQSKGTEGGAVFDQGSRGRNGFHHKQRQAHNHCACAHGGRQRRVKPVMESPNLPAFQAYSVHTDDLSARGEGSNDERMPMKVLQICSICIGAAVEDFGILRQLVATARPQRNAQHPLPA
jgi:bud site selection protein 20